MWHLELKIRLTDLLLLKLKDVTGVASADLTGLREISCVLGSGGFCLRCGQGAPKGSWVMSNSRIGKEGANEECFAGMEATLQEVTIDNGITRK